RHDRRAQARRIRFLRVRALLAGAMVLGVGAVLTLAAWTDQEQAKTTVTAGTVAIESQVSGTTWASNGTTAVVLPLDATGLYPNQSRAAWVQIRTVADSLPGTVSLTGVQVSVPAEADPHSALRGSLRVRAATVAGPSSCTTGADLGADAAIAAVPAPAQTAQLLAGKAQHVVTYCIIVSLPSSAPSSAQGGQVTPTWTFTGTTG